jgi:hypothetical protein
LSSMSHNGQHLAEVDAHSALSLRRTVFEEGAIFAGAN